MVSALVVGTFTIIRGIFKIHQARKENVSKPGRREIFSIVWKQLVGSLPLALLLSLFVYYLQQFLTSPDSPPANNPLFDLFALWLIAGGCVLAALCGLTWWLLHLRAARRQTREQAKQQLIQQTIHNHP